MRCSDRLIKEGMYVYMYVHDNNMVFLCMIFVCYIFIFTHYVLWYVWYIIFLKTAWGIPSTVWYRRWVFVCTEGCGCGRARCLLVHTKVGGSKHFLILKHCLDCALSSLLSRKSCLREIHFQADKIVGG
jgi:hypothetical protein